MPGSANFRAPRIQRRLGDKADPVRTERGLTRIEATAAGAAAWTDHVLALGQGLLLTEVDSWMTGINRNVEGKQDRRIMRYSGGHPEFREHCEAVAADGYRELALA